MLTPTLEHRLHSYEIGPKMRALRLRKKLGLVELGRHTGLSPALLSKLERGRLYPTLPTLLRIAMVFDVGLEYFFAGAREKPTCGVVRKAERLTFQQASDKGDSQYEFQSLDYTAQERKLNAFLAEFLPPSAENQHHHSHAGGEFIYVLTGILDVRVGSEQHILQTGDSMYFDSSVPHGYCRHGTRPCRAVVVTTSA